MATICSLQIECFVFAAYLLCQPVTVLSQAPTVRIDAGLVAGERTLLGGKEVDSFLGIPYAEPPIGELRFERPVPVQPWNATYNATGKPAACLQLDFPYLPDAALNYSNASEDCLYVNVWRPARGCELSSDGCDANLPVFVYIHGGAFQWGDSALFLHDMSNLVALANVVAVGFNYRVSALGFLTTNTPEFPGNYGLWDQHLLLNWVQNNIRSFGGNPDEVTLGGQSAGAVSAALFSISPQGRGLYKRLFLQSGATPSMIIAKPYKGISKFIGVASGLGCYDGSTSWDKQIAEVARCLKTADARDILKRLKGELPVKQIFPPVSGDDFLPTDPLLAVASNRIRATEIFLGTVSNEGSMFVHNIRSAASQLSDLLITADYRLVLTFGLSTLFDVPVSASSKIVKHYYGDHKVKHKTTAVIDIFSRLFGDGAFYCPVVFFAEKAAAQGIKTYRYLFKHRPTFTAWPKPFGVVHGEDTLFTLASLPFLKDRAKHTPHTWEVVNDNFGKQNHTDEEEAFMVQLVDMLASYVRTG